MQASQIPTLVPLAFAANGNKNTIPEASQISTNPGAASLNDGFPPATMTPLAAGGTPMSGPDLNGILNLATQSIRWQHGGGHYGYNSTFANDTNVGGYPRGALLLRSDQSGMWLNQTDNNTTNPDTGGAGWSAAFMSGTVGAVRNLVMFVGTASASATLTADEIVVGSALGGQKYVLAGFSATGNLATTGVNGMDTGAAPVNGVVAEYAIFNPTTGAKGLLYQNATSIVAPNVYGGTSMPSGYTASALVGVWPTNGSGQFIPGYQRDRHIDTAVTPQLSTTSPTTTVTALTLSSIPKNAIYVDLSIAAVNGTSGSAVQFIVNGSAQGIGYITALAQPSSGTMDDVVKGRIPLVVAQTAYYSMLSTAAGTFTINSTGYDF